MIEKPKVQSAFSFRLMSLEFRLRDMLRPPEQVLREAGVKPGMTVVDFGCGPGGFSVAAARLVGPAGQVYAVDINPLALASVQRSAERRDMQNIRTMHGGTLDEVPGSSADIVLLYDILHDFPHPAPVMQGIHRVLKPGGLLSVSDHHLQEALILAAVTGGGLFRHIGSDRYTIGFEPVPARDVAT